IRSRCAWSRSRAATRSTTNVRAGEADWTRGIAPRAEVDRIASYRTLMPRTPSGAPEPCTARVISPGRVLEWNCRLSARAWLVRFLRLHPETRHAVNRIQPRRVVVDPAGLSALSILRINVAVGSQSPAIARAPAAA